MVKPSSPSDAVNGAMASLHGKRTGIVLPNKGDVPVDNDGMENMEALFDGAKTPQPENKNEEEPRLKGKNAATKPKKTMPRLSLPGQSTDGEEEEETVADKTKRVLSRMGGGAISPSELSRVSTAPPTPTFVAIQEEEEATTKGEEEAAEHPPLSPPEEVRASPQEEQEEAVVPQESGTSPTARVELQTQEEPEDGNFPVDDDEDDMIPPPPPEPEDTDLSLREEEANATQEEVEFPVDADDDFDDDDDDKEGTGFAIVHDPETPESVRAEREKEAKEKEKKKKAKRKKKDTSSVAAKSTRSKASKSTAKPTKTKRTKKKVTITTSPTGYPAGNREYKLVPVSDFKDSPQEQGVRRSRRARVKPLAFWKNERPVYEPNHEDGVLGEAMGQMSVVAGYMSAQPTPYKKRKVAETAKSKNGNKRAKTGATLEDEEFDSRKLRKVSTNMRGIVKYSFYCRLILLFVAVCPEIQVHRWRKGQRVGRDGRRDHGTK
jgi:centromere protein C